MVFRLYQSWALVIVLGLSVLVHVWPVAAHGDEGTLQLDQVQLGSYRLSAWTYPWYLSVGRVALSIAVIDSQSRAAIQNCEILVQLTPSEKDGVSLKYQPVSYPTLQHPLYDFEIEPTTPGPYRVSVQVQDASGWMGKSSFGMVVHSEAVWLKGLIIVLLIVAGLVGAWLAQDAVRVWDVPHWALWRKA